MAPAHAHPIQEESARGDNTAGEPSVSSAIEHVVASSQGLITKRIDLALLEGQELVSRTLQRAALGVCGIVLAAAAWFALAACLVLLVTPGGSLVLHLAAFGLLNAGGAMGLVALAVRRRAETPESANDKVSSTTDEG